MKLLTTALSGLAIALLATVFFALQKPRESVVTFELQRVKGQFIHQLALHHANQQAVTTSSASFKQKLQHVLDDYAREKGVVILDGKQVLSSGKDITEEIIPRLARAMRGPS